MPNLEGAAALLRRKRPVWSIHTQETDDRLFELFRVHGSKWRKIAVVMGGAVEGFSEDACRNRIIRELKKKGIEYKPVLERSKPKKPKITGRWTSEEDEKLLKLVHENGGSNEWEKIASEFSGRTKQAVRNRSQRILRASLETDPALLNQALQEPDPPPVGRRRRRRLQKKEKKETDKKQTETQVPDAYGAEDEKREVCMDSAEEAPCSEFDLYLPEIEEDLNMIQRLDDGIRMPDMI